MAFGLTRIRNTIEAASRKALGSLTCTITQDPVVALTFDDGPHPTHTPRILQILERYQAKATFFMVGQAAHRYPELVRLVAEKGHAIGSHSWDHTPFPLMSGRERRRQMLACERALAPFAQRLFRPPYGHQILTSRLDALWLGYEVVSWSVDFGDWCEHDVSRMVERFLHNVRPGAIVLLHETLFQGEKPAPGRMVDERLLDRQAPLTALEEMLNQIGTRFRFVTIPELLQCGSPCRRFLFQRTRQ